MQNLVNNVSLDFLHIFYTHDSTAHLKSCYCLWIWKLCRLCVKMHWSRVFAEELRNQRERSENRKCSDTRSKNVSAQSWILRDSINALHRIRAASVEDKVFHFRKWKSGIRSCKGENATVKGGILFTRAWDFANTMLVSCAIQCNLSVVKVLCAVIFKIIEKIL